LKPRQYLEAGLLFSSIFWVGQIVFGGWMATGIKNYPLEYLGIPFLLWAAFRSGRHGASAAAFELPIIAPWGH
jgi:integral membrane sensor domain MASE1